MNLNVSDKSKLGVCLVYRDRVSKMIVIIVAGPSTEYLLKLRSEIFRDRSMLFNLSTATGQSQSKRET
jgi:hypothetical protein